MDDDLSRAARAIAEARHVVALTGAGVSAESGLPTFRGDGGLWRGRSPWELASPRAFQADPGLVWEFYNWRRGLVAAASPNPAHLALAAMAAYLPRLTVVTQNVDRLHQKAGSVGVLELHGNLDNTRCTGCGIMADRAGEALPPLPRCEACNGLLRPAVVWFGEPLPPGVWHEAREAVREADVLLVVGTSAMVQPAAGLATSVWGPGRVVIEVNLGPTAATGAVDIGLYGPAGEVLPKLVPTP